MKKLYLLCLIPVCFLVSCDVHFGDVHYDVPWWVIAVIVVPVVLIIFYRASLKTHHAHTCVTNLCYNKGNQAKEQKRWETEGFLTKIFDLQN